MLKLESLETKRLENLNEIVGGDTGMGMDKDDYETLSCHGNCVFKGRGFMETGTVTGDEITLD